MQGGSRPQMPQGAGNVTGVSGQPHHSQTSSGIYINIFNYTYFHCIFSY